MCQDPGVQYGIPPSDSDCNTYTEFSNTSYPNNGFPATRYGKLITLFLIILMQDLEAKRASETDLLIRRYSSFMQDLFQILTEQAHRGGEYSRCYYPAVLRESKLPVRYR